MGRISPTGAATVPMARRDSQSSRRPLERRKLDRKMTDAFHAIWEIHTEQKVSLRTAAFIKALQRVTRAEIHRGFD